MHGVLWGRNGTVALRTISHKLLADNYFDYEDNTEANTKGERMEKERRRLEWVALWCATECWKFLIHTPKSDVQSKSGARTVKIR